ncbi:MAG: 5'-nucleotidase C-terminal domain-containing protein [Bacteroidota bacterium]
MNLESLRLFTIICLLFFASCNQQNKLVSIQAEEIRIDGHISEEDSIAAYIAPFRRRIKQVLDSSLAYVPVALTKGDGEYNTSAGNFMADVIYSEANPIYKARTGNGIDFALLNHGGIRADIPKGKVNARTAYEIMPFENNIVVVELPGKFVLNLVEYLIKSERPHPLSNIQIVLNRHNTLQYLKINGKPFDINRTYQVATSSYLVTGGDNMTFFEGMTRSVDLDYLVRNAIIDYLKKVDTVKATVDNRFIKLD